MDSLSILTLAQKKTLEFNQVISVPFLSDVLQPTSRFLELVLQYFSNTKIIIIIIFAYKCQNWFLLLANREEPAKEIEPDRTEPDRGQKKTRRVRFHKTQCKSIS